MKNVIDATIAFFVSFISVLLSVLDLIQGRKESSIEDLKYLQEVEGLILCLTIAVWLINWYILFYNKYSKTPLTLGKKIAFFIISMLLIKVSLIFCNLIFTNINDINDLFDPIIFMDWWMSFSQEWMFIFMGTLYAYLIHISFILWIVSSNEKNIYLPWPAAWVLIFLGSFCITHALFLYIITFWTAIKKDCFLPKCDEVFLENQLRFILKTFLPAVAYALLLTWGIKPKDEH